MGISDSRIAEIASNPKALSFGSRLRYYCSAKEWISNLTGSDIAISQRIHGTIAAINAGVPALCVYHDARTEELCKAMGVPSSNTMNVLPGISSLNPAEGIVKVIEKADFGRLDIARKKYANALLSVFDSLSIKPSLQLSSIAGS
jgi:polysaccharide pyruvyl transferase WcaK-like protein